MESDDDDDYPFFSRRNRRRRPRFKPGQHISDRIDRALSQDLRLLCRRGSTFSISGSTGNSYTVRLSSTPSCTCPDLVTPCKHILFVFIRVLGASIDDVCPRRGTLQPYQLQRLLSVPTSPETVAGDTLSQSFDDEEGSDGTSIEVEDGATEVEEGSSGTSIEMEDGATRPILDRIDRALSQPLRLLHRRGSTFSILGSVGNAYTVRLSSTPSCTCPDIVTPCKHILFVFIRVLGASIDDVCLRRGTLRPGQLQRLLSMPTLPETVAGGTLRQRFHPELFVGREGGSNGTSIEMEDGATGQGRSNETSVEMEDGATCPVCLDEMGKEEKLVVCGRCRNPIHEECLLRWKRTKGRKSATCVICRASWRD